MRECEACGQQLSGQLDRCSHCGHPVADAAAHGHLSRSAIAGRAGATLYAQSATATSVAIDPVVPAAATAPIANGTKLDRAEGPSSPTSPDFDPDATMRFTPIYRSHSDLRNTAALVGLAIALIAAVLSLAWLIGQSVITGPATPRDPASASAKPTALSTAVPRGATICTPELARNQVTNCTVARRVFAEVRRLGTDVPDSFRVTITDPLNPKKNLTFVCTMHAWIECVGPDQNTIYVRRVA